MDTGRTKDQCLQRYNNSLHEAVRKGHFTEEEDFMIMVGTKLFGESSWVKIAEFIPSRNPSQLQSRYSNFHKGAPEEW